MKKALFFAFLLGLVAGMISTAVASTPLVTSDISITLQTEKAPAANIALTKMVTKESKKVDLLDQALIVAPEGTFPKTLTEMEAGGGDCRVPTKTMYASTLSFEKGGQIDTSTA